MPATKLTTVVTRKAMPGSMTKPAVLSSATAIPNAWKMAKAKVPMRVYCVILRRPASPSFFNCSNVGTT